MLRLLSCYILAMRPGAWPLGMSYPYGPEPYPTFGTVEGDVDEPKRFLQDLFAVMEDRARGNEERLAAGLFGDKRQSHSFLNRSGQ